MTFLPILADQFETARTAAYDHAAATKKRVAQKNRGAEVPPRFESEGEPVVYRYLSGTRRTSAQMNSIHMNFHLAGAPPVKDGANIAIPQLEANTTDRKIRQSSKRRSVGGAGIILRKVI